VRLSIRSDCNRTNEARPIDGASTFRTFRQIILPNAYPALAALASFQGLFGVNWNWVLAGAMFNAVPIILLVIFFQKYFIRSAASSAVKG